MKYRSKMKSGHSKRLFSHTAGAQKVHPKNLRTSSPMRGGIRL